MTISDNDLARVDEFFNSVARCLLTERNEATVSYLAVRQSGTFTIEAARLILGAYEQQPSLPDALETDNVRAGCFRLSEIGRTPRQFLDAVLQRGEFCLPRAALSFPGNDSKTHGVWLQNLDPSALHARRRVRVLRIFGGVKQAISSLGSDFDWELKAAETPYEDLADLSKEFRLGSQEGNTTSFEIVAPNALEITPDSSVRDGVASITVAAQFNLDRPQVSLRIKVASQGRIILRRYVSPSLLGWTEEVGFHGRATYQLDVPAGSTVHCVAVYERVAQHERVLVDQSSTENVLRLALESCDEKFGYVRQSLHLGGTPKSDSDGHEAAIAWTLSMLGFRVIHLGTGILTRDNVDVMAYDGAQGLLLIECTIGVLKHDKVANLVARYVRVGRYLADQGRADIKVLPVIVTTMTAAEVDPSIDKTERDGILVMCREQVEEWLSIAAASPEPKQIFEKAVQRLADAMSRPQHS